MTNKEEYNKRHKFKKEEPHSKKEISKISKVPMKVLDDVYDRGVGAFKTNPKSVRPQVKSKEQWAMGRVYSFVNKMEGKKKLNHDKDLLKEIPKLKGKNLKSI
jgi:hypothetical protein|tara:strand:- start:936 stop:1244 length:309 start_codon:yes stop_codon:yes gene_type:complete